MELQKQCPRCKTPIYLHAPHCWNCGHTFRTQFDAYGNPITRQAPPVPVASVPPPHPTIQDNRIRRAPGTHSVTLAVLLSLFCLACGGQIYNGQIGKAAFYFLAACAITGIQGGLAYAAALEGMDFLAAWQAFSWLLAPLGFLLAGCAALDAGLIAGRLNRGEAVTGWQWF